MMIWRHVSGTLVDAVLGLLLAGLLAGALVGLGAPLGESSLLAIALLVTAAAVFGGHLVRRRLAGRGR